MAGKRFVALRKKVDPERKYLVQEACQLVAECAGTKFDQTVDVAVRLGVDPKQSDQQVRGAVNLPHGLGKKFVVVVFAKGPKEQEARDAGADFVGGQDLVDKITGGWMDFDKVIATPDMMPMVSKVGKLLGPRGLMPNPKTGTVSFEVGVAVKECKAGKMAFKTEKGGIIHGAIGKVSFGADKIRENLRAFVDEVVRLKPASSKGIYLRSLSVSSTMGPGVGVDVGSLEVH